MQVDRRRPGPAHRPEGPDPHRRPGARPHRRAAPGERHPPRSGPHRRRRLPPAPARGAGALHPPGGRPGQGVGRAEGARADERRPTARSSTTRSTRSTACAPCPRARSPAAGWSSSPSDRRRRPRSILRCSRSSTVPRSSATSVARSSRGHIRHARASRRSVGRVPGRALDLGSGGGLPGLVLARSGLTRRWRCSTAAAPGRRSSPKRSKSSSGRPSRRSWWATGPRWPATIRCVGRVRPRGRAVVRTAGGHRRVRGAVPRRSAASSW